jgi:regulator of protease activity HflC (stomatin/prohibitin superfamily)
MSVQTQAHSTTSQVPSKEGLPIDLEVAILYRVDPERVVEIYKNVGVNYAAVILHPQFRSAVRQVTSSKYSHSLASCSLNCS